MRLVVLQAEGAFNHHTIASANAQPQPSRSQIVQRERLLSHHYRMTGIDSGDGRPKSEPPGAHGHGSKERENIGDGRTSSYHPDLLNASLLGLLNPGKSAGGIAGLDGNSNSFAI